jgi:hypothetical protein
LKLGFKCFIALVVALMASFCVSASDTTTKFKTGPFTGSVDLGVPCNDTNIIEPRQGETLSGDNYTEYVILMCGVSIILTRYDKDLFDLTTAYGTSDATRNLINSGADKDTIVVYDREINSKSGAVGSGYVPRVGAIEYMAFFNISPKSKGYIFIWGNQTAVISALKTIHVTENA